MNHFDWMMPSLSCHELKLIEPYTGTIGLYRCASKKHRSRYSYNVILAPGYVSIHGDIGNGVFLFQDDPLDWLKNLNYNSIEYVLSKLSRPGKEFSEDKLIRNLEYLKNEGRAGREDFNIISAEWLKRTAEASEHEFPDIWSAIWHECLPGQDMLNCMDYAWSDYWVAYALIVFARLFEGKPIIQNTVTELHHQGHLSVGPFPH